MQTPRIVFSIQKEIRIEYRTKFRFHQAFCFLSLGCGDSSQGRDSDAGVGRGRLIGWSVCFSGWLAGACGRAACCTTHTHAQQEEHAASFVHVAASVLVSGKPEEGLLASLRVLIIEFRHLKRVTVFLAPRVYMIWEMELVDSYLCPR